MILIDAKWDRSRYVGTCAVSVRVPAVSPSIALMRNTTCTYSCWKLMGSFACGRKEAFFASRYYTAQCSHAGQCPVFSVSTELSIGR